MAANPGSGGAQGAIIACPRPTTTFVHVDTNTFRDVVRRLTGPSEGDSSPAAAAASSSAAPAHGKVPTGLRKPTSSRLHERRQYSMMRPKLDIVKPPAFHHKVSASSPSKTGGYSSSVVVSPLGTPSQTFSKLSIIEVEANRAEEEKAIKERRFYLHPSPRSTKPAGYPEPELLPLFPLTSPKLDDAPSP